MTAKFKLKKTIMSGSIVISAVDLRKARNNLTVFSKPNRNLEELLVYGKHFNKFYTCVVL